MFNIPEIAMWPCCVCVCVFFSSLFTATLPHSKAMGKASSAHSRIWTQVPPTQKSTSGIMASELIQDNLQVANTQVAYRSAEAIANKWLLEMIEKSKSNESTKLPDCLTSLLHHNLALVSFEKPTEIIVPLLAEYITY